MEDTKYLETISQMSNTIKELAIEKERKINGYKTIIIVLIIALVATATLYASSVNYFVHSIYNYQYTISNTNTNTNENTNRGDN